MSKFVAVSFGLVIFVLISIWIQMAGWGLHAVSWSVIVWGAILQFVVLLFIQLADSKDD